MRAFSTPLPGYDAETLSGLREALEAHDLVRARQQALRLGEAIRHAIEVLACTGFEGN